MWLKDIFDFYPTPENVIEKVLQSVNIVGQTILEPSAGSGNFVKFLKRNGAKEVFTWRFFCGEKFSEWPGIESEKELFD